MSLNTAVPNVSLNVALASVSANPNSFQEFIRRSHSPIRGTRRVLFTTSAEMTLHYNALRRQRRYAAFGKSVGMRRLDNTDSGGGGIRWEKRCFCFSKTAPESALVCVRRAIRVLFHLYASGRQISRLQTTPAKRMTRCEDDARILARTRWSMAEKIF